MTSTCSVSFSVVSHGQLSLTKHFLHDFLVQSFGHIEIILTLNIHEDESFNGGFSDLPLITIKNNVPKAFGANHNHAFSQSKGNVRNC